MIAIGWLGAVLALLGAVFSGDRVGAVLFGIAAVALAAGSAHGTLIRPRLMADARGIRIRTVRGTVDLGWPDARIRLQFTRRLGRDAVTLEIDAGEHLFVLGRLELGDDPHDVLDALIALRR